MNGFGMPLCEVIARSTVNAATIIDRPERGTFRRGAVGGASILPLKDGRFGLEDVEGGVLEADRRLSADGVVVAGRWWHPA